MLFTIIVHSDYSVVVLFCVFGVRFIVLYARRLAGKNACEMTIQYVVVRCGL